MAKVRLTRRGKIVVALLILGVVWAMFRSTTPIECRVDLEQMPQWCVEFLYP